MFPETPIWDRKLRKNLVRTDPISRYNLPQGAPRYRVGPNQSLLGLVRPCLTHKPRVTWAWSTLGQAEPPSLRPSSPPCPTRPTQTRLGRNPGPTQPSPSLVGLVRPCLTHKPRVTWAWRTLGQAEPPSLRPSSPLYTTYPSVVGSRPQANPTQPVASRTRLPLFKGEPEPLEKEIHEILGSKCEDRFSDPFFDWVQNTSLVRFSYLLCLCNFCWKTTEDIGLQPNSGIWWEKPPFYLQHYVASARAHGSL